MQDTPASEPEKKPENTPIIPKVNLDNTSVLVPPEQQQQNREKKEPFEIKTESTPLPKIPDHKIKLWMKILLGVVAFFVVLVLIIAGQGYFLYSKAKKMTPTLSQFSNTVKSANISQIKTELPAVKTEVNSFYSSFKLALWMKYVPYLGGYVSDADHALKAGIYAIDAGEILIDTAEPYAKELGFAQDSAEKSIQERIDFVVSAIPDLVPKIDDINSRVAMVESEISQIDAADYPEKYKGIMVRTQIKKVQDLVEEGSGFLSQIKPVLQATPYLLGIDSPRNYLVLFQNDKELRPTGGFMTAYSIMKVDKAKFEPVASDDIYNLDAKYKPSIEAPQPIVDMIKGPYVLSQKLRFRDMNWSPDFEQSMKLVSEASQEVGINDVDGIIAMDTQLLVNLLDVIGPIGVPGFGNFSTENSPECNCPQVIHELESFADVEGPIVWDPVSGEIVYKPKNADNRKKIIGPLMNSILANALGQPKEKLPQLFEAAFKSLIEKHVLFYVYDEGTQKALSDFGLAGKIVDYDGDYLHINDANLGGRKSNLYVTQSVEQNITVAKDGSVEKTVTITYNNPEKYDGWLNSVLPNWVRVYVPKGSQLVSSDGLDKDAQSYEDLGKTVFAGSFSLRPEGVSKVTFKYRLPMKFNDYYNLLIQKQPGTDAPLYTTILGKYEEEIVLNKDTKVRIKI